MKLYALTLLLGNTIAASDSLRQVATNEESKLLLRVFVTQTDCTAASEAQCNGQNWIGSACCADPSYECRWDDDGQNVKRCQQISKDNQLGHGTPDDSNSIQVQSHHEFTRGGGDVSGPAQVDSPKQNDKDDRESDDNDDEERQILTVEPGIASSTSIQPRASTDSSAKFVDLWESCTDGERCKENAECVRHSVHYSQCKP
ncbi:hypothetical protein Gpo141_00013720 [Globisporangium polare]